MKKKIDYKKQGKRNKASGRKFELFVRKDLEEKGWIVSKWMNTLDFDYEADKFYKVPKGTTVLLKPAKHKFRGVGIPMAIGTGFPDFIIYKPRNSLYQIIFVEVKTRGYLSKEEKEKANWYLKNKLCSKFLIAKKLKQGRKVVVEYKEFTEC